MKTLALLAALAVGCSGSVEPTLEVGLPMSCRVEPEYIRVQLCPRQPVLVQCSNVAQTNMAPGHCDGPDWTEGKQVSGNAWCCQDDVVFVSSK